MGLPGTDLNHRAAFLYARIGAALLALIACNAVAEAPALIAQDAWVREVPGSDVAAVYLTLRNPTTRPISIVSVESPVASHAMIHETKTESGQSRMRPHEQLVVPPGQTVKLEPGGLHIMLDGITRPERSEGNPEKRQRRDDRSAEKGIPRSASGATRDAGRPTAVGQSVPLVLLLADGNKVQVAAVVRPLTAQ
jgi:periplasmic copper chaperone A